MIISINMYPPWDGSAVKKKQASIASYYLLVPFHDLEQQLISFPFQYLIQWRNVIAKKKVVVYMKYN